MLVRYVDWIVSQGWCHSSSEVSGSGGTSRRKAGAAAAKKARAAAVELGNELMRWNLMVTAGSTKSSKAFEDKKNM